MKKIPNRKIILFLMAITISFGAFAQNEAVTEKYLVRANDNYNIKMYKLMCLFGLEVNKGL